MFRIKIVCVGKMKEAYFRDACGEYVKRLSRFGEVTVREVKEENIVERPSEKEKQEIMRREAEHILKELSGEVVVLAVEGKQQSSEDFAQTLSSIRDGKGEVTFVIGGSYGLDGEVKKRAKKLLSFSKMTLPHTLMRVVLLEQIYRACMIDAGSTYHK